MPNVGPAPNPYPANTTVGYPGNSGLPLGSWLRLDPSVNVAALGLPPLETEIATALQKYGMFLRDIGSTVCIIATDQVNQGGNAVDWPAVGVNLTSSTPSGVPYAREPQQQLPLEQAPTPSAAEAADNRGNRGCRAATPGACRRICYDSPNGGIRRRLRVLTMIDCMMTSGAEIFATRIALALDPQRFESTIASTRASAPAHIATARAAGVRVIELNRRSKLDVWGWAPLVRLLRSGEIDVVHAHKIGSNMWAAALSHVVDMPVLIAHEHTWSFTGNPSASWSIES